MKKLLLAALMFTTPALGQDISSNANVQRAGALMAAVHICRVKDDKMVTLLLRTAMEETGQPKEVVVDAAIAHASDIGDLVLKNPANRKEFCAFFKK